MSIAEKRSRIVLSQNYEGLDIVVFFSWAWEDVIEHLKCYRRHFGENIVRL